MQRFKHRSINVKYATIIIYTLYFKYQLADHEVQTLNNLVNFYFRSLIEINIYFYLNTKYSSISDLIIILFSLFYPFNKFLLTSLTFQAIDKDGSGFITVGELRSLGNMDSVKTEALMEKLDRNAT